MANSKKTKTKTKTNAKSKTKAKVTTRVVSDIEELPQPVETEDESTPLTTAEEFYIENNPKKTETELAIALGKPLPMIREHLHRTQGSGRINKLMIRQKGCTVMTAGASEAADQTRKGYASQQSIMNAVGRGDYEEAARLQAMMKVNQQTDDDAARRRQEGHIFYMHSAKNITGDVRK